ncbi:MAG: hypothetical protein ACON4U_09160 [Myxococcota bacterium]
MSVFSFLSMSLIGLAQANEPICGNLTEPPDLFQVAWISPTTERAWSAEHIEVVRLVDFRTWVREEEADAKAVLHAVGLLSKKSQTEIEASDYKITVFDIKSDWLCRPIKSFDEGELREGLPICHTKEQRWATWSRRHGFTGCGTIQNTNSKGPHFEVYRIPWGQAITWGFTTMPLDRFLDGA